MLSGLYLGSIALASITTGVYAIKVKQEIEKEGLKIDKSKLTTGIIIREAFCAICGIIIPGINLFYSALLLGLRQDLYEELKKNFRIRGYIPNDSMNRSRNTNEKVKINTRRATTKKRYEEMTREEKRRVLQKELSNMLEEKTSKEDEGPKLQLKRTYNRK